MSDSLSGQQWLGLDRAEFANERLDPGSPWETQERWGPGGSMILAFQALCEQEAGGSNWSWGVKQGSWRRMQVCQHSKNEETSFLFQHGIV